MVTIGIATKNRWKDLEITLQKATSYTNNEVDILVYDDASDQSCPFEVLDISKRITLVRFESSKGYIARRNQIAKSIKTKYYLSLDDDSYPVNGKLEDAIFFAENTHKLLCLSFPIYSPFESKYSNQSISNNPYQVRSFIGCGHLLNVELFLSLGSYIEELVHQGEEMDVSARAFQEGYYCYHFPSFVIHHLASNSGRNWYRMDFYGARNNVLWNDWYVPRGRMFFKQFRTFISRILLFIKNRRTGSIKGFFGGILSLKKYEHRRKNMSIENYKNWRKLPHC